MSDGQTDQAEEREERQRLAERWRRLGKILRCRSPEAFEKLFVMLMASTSDDDDDQAPDIDAVYPIH